MDVILNGILKKND